MDGYRHTRIKAKRWLRWLAGALAAALVAVIALSSGGMPADDNVHGAVYDWARDNPGQDVPILVQTVGESATVAEFIDSSGGTVQSESEIIPAVEADVSPDFVPTLADHPDVVSISLDAPVVSTGGPGNDGGNSEDETTGDSPAPSLVPTQPPAVVVPPGVIAYVLGSTNSKDVAKEVSLDLQAAGIRGASLYSVDWGAINWGAINWDTINWGAIDWDAIDWDAVDWDAITWWDTIDWDAIDWDAISWDDVNWDAIKSVGIKWGATPDDDGTEWTDIIE